MVRFACIALILGALIGFLDLKSVLPGSWSERTIIAFTVVLTFCAILLLGTHDETLKVAKEIALIVIGFYFGASKGSQEEKPIVARPPIEP